MKIIPPLAAGILAISLTSLPFISSSQEWQPTTSFELTNELPAEPQLMEPEAVPFAGTFFMLSDFQNDSFPPPYPCNPFFPTSVYSTSLDGVFVVDDSEARPGVFQPVANVDLATLEIWGRVDTLINTMQQLRFNRSLQSSMVMTTSSLDPGIPGDGEGGTNEWNPEIGFSAAVYGTNDFWLEIVGVTNGIVSLTIHGTDVDQSYEILSKETLEASGWSSEGELILGLEGQTPATVSMDTRTSQLFFCVRSWLGSDGSGMPDWWQMQWFGMIGIDPYDDDDGDGWVNMQEYQNGTNPNGFNTPPAPSGLAVNYNSVSGDVNVSWNPSPGLVTGYIVSKSEFYSGITTTYTLSSSVTSLNDIVPNVPDSAWDCGPTRRIYYRVQAQYASENSPWSEARLEPWAGSEDLKVSLIGGSSGSAWLAASALPARTVALRIMRVDRYAHIMMGDSSQDASWDIPMSSFTNGLCQLAEEIVFPGADTYGNGEYSWWVQAVNDGNGLTHGSELNMSWYTYYEGDHAITWAVPPFRDGRQQLKDNLAFVLRAATINSPFLYWRVTPGSPTDYIEYPTDYGYAGFRSPSGYMQVFTPFLNNCEFRNFVFNLEDVDSYGEINTGLSTTVGPNYQPLLHLPPTYEFPGLGAALPDSLLAPNDTRWLSLALVGAMLPDVGLSTTLPSHLTNGTRNLYGLPFVSALVAFRTNNSVQTMILPAGVSTSQSGWFYSETEQPQLQQAGYNFWSADSDTLPGHELFSTASTNNVLIASVGKVFPIAGFLKYQIQNGYTGKYAYLGQYFDQACTLGTNGVATTNSAGLLSPYGEFFPTTPGPAALVTMADIDPPYQRGTGVVHVVKLNLDVDHDGVMDLSFGGPDNTSQARPFTFWANNDYDRAHTVDLFDWEEDDVKTADCPYTPRIATPDYAYRNAAGHNVIPCNRDLEDYTRLWIPGLSSLWSVMPTNYTVRLTLNGDGAIRIFRAVEANGETNYLFNESVASNQVNNAASLYVGLLTSSSPIFLTSSNEHFIWCGVQRGKAEVHLQIFDENQNTLTDTAAYIEIKDIKEMYERWTVGDQGTNAPWSAARVAVEDLPPGTSGFQYPSTSSDSETPYILHVHGWNMERFDKDRFGESMFKRLYWQGYDGQFGIFRWPTLAKFPSLSGEGADLNNYDKSEYNAWLSGAPLRKLLVDLDAKHPGLVRLSAHSMGNVVAGEALRTNSPLVAVYIAMQAAVPSGAYWLAAPFRAIPTIYFDGTTELYRFYPAFTPSRPYFNIAAGAADYVNFYNQSDWALNLWITDQNLKPDDTLGYSFESSTSTFFQFQGTPSQRILTAPLNTFELFAFSVEGQCWALGAQTSVAGVFTTGRELDLDSAFAFGDAHKGHSAQFRSTNMKRAAFWTIFSTRMGVK